MRISAIHLYLCVLIMLVVTITAIPPNPSTWAAHARRLREERDPITYANAAPKRNFLPPPPRTAADNLRLDANAHANKLSGDRRMSHINAIAEEAPLVFVPSSVLDRLHDNSSSGANLLYAVQGAQEKSPRIVTSETAFGAKLNKRRGCSEGPSWEYPCVSEKTGNQLFTSCCDLHQVPSQCHDLCKYDSDQNTIRKLVVEWNRPECLSYMSPIVHCASQSNDNTQCCKDLGFAQLANGPYCYKYCDPTGHRGIKSFGSADLVCAANWEVIMWCHRSGLQFEDVDRKYTPKKTQPWRRRRI